MNQYIVGAIGLWMIMVLTGLNHAGQQEGGTSSPGYYWINPDGSHGLSSPIAIQPETPPKALAWVNPNGVSGIVVGGTSERLDSVDHAYWINPDGFRGGLSRRLIPSAPIYSRVTAR
jgi:elongation factor P hydroxylase